MSDLVYGTYGLTDDLQTAVEVNEGQLEAIKQIAQHVLLQLRALYNDSQIIVTKHISDFEMLTDASASSSVAASKIAEPGDLLLAITGATIGKIGIVVRYDRLAFSGDLLQLRVREGLDPYYLLVVLRSPVGQGQLLRWVTGSTNGHLAPREVMRVLTPRLGKTERVISDLVQESLFARKEAEALLEQAKHRVEELVEQEAS